jgi:hypothetical protein
MHIQWEAFGEVFMVSFGVAVGLIAVFAIGVGLLSAPTRTPDGPRLTVATADTSTTPPTTTRVHPTITRRVTAWMCFLACALSVAYGLYLIIAR